MNGTENTTTDGNKVTGIRQMGEVTMNKYVAATLLAIIGGSFATAQTIDDLVGRRDGLYFPASAAASSWSCNADYIGLEGGALGIGGGYLDGLENRCKLVNAKPTPEGTGISFTAICAACQSQSKKGPDRGVKLVH